MTASTAPRGVVERMFAAFAAADLDALLATVHPESRWTYIGANLRLSKATFSGHDAVRKFFERILHRLDVSHFTPSEYLVRDNTVVVFGSEAGTVRSDNRQFRNEWVQKYVVDAGLIIEMVEYNVQVEPRA